MTQYQKNKKLEEISVILKEEYESYDTLKEKREMKEWFYSLNFGTKQKDHFWIKIMGGVE